MSRGNLQLVHAHLVTPGAAHPDSGLRIEDGRIRSIGPGASGDRGAAEVFDAQGHLVVPGFIDIHTHGVAGVSVMDGTEEAMRHMAGAKLREGVTQFLPTTWTAPEEDLVRALEGVAAYMARPDFARVPGAHIEGPFLNPGCVGAQNPAFVRPPDIAEVDRLAAVAPVKLLSVAVEQPGGIGFVRDLAARGIIPSLAHTAATHAQFLEAKAAGLKHLTHFCNQMTPLHHREIGLVGAGLLDDEICLEMICDGIHLCPEMIALVFKHVPAERILLITDSISASGQPDGEYVEAGLKVRVEDGICRLESGALAGSTLRFDRAVEQVRRVLEKPLESWIATTSWNQARSLGLGDRFGRIEQGYAGDLTVLDPKTLEVRATIVGGEVRWCEGVKV